MTSNISSYRFNQPQFGSQTTKSPPLIAPGEPTVSNDKASLHETEKESKVPLKRSGLKKAQKQIRIQNEQIRLKTDSKDLQEDHLALVSIKSQNNQPVYVLKATKDMPLRLENKPVKKVAYKAGQHIQVGNTLYKVTPSLTFVKISDNAALINQLCPEGLGKLHCNQGQMSNCNSLAELMAMFNEPAGLLIRHILSQFSEKKIATPKGPVDCFAIQFGNFEIQIPKNHLTNARQELAKEHVQDDKKFKAKHPVLGRVLKPVMLLFNMLDLRASDQESYWLEGDFDTTHAVSGSPLVALFEKAHYEFIGLQEYREAYKKLHYRYPNIRTIEPGFNQREDIISTIDQAKASGWSGNPHQIDRTHSMRAQRNSKWQPSKAEAIQDFLSLASPQRNPTSVHSFFQTQNQIYPNKLYISDWNSPKGHLKKFSMMAWRPGTQPYGTDQAAGFKTALDSMSARERASWIKHFKAYLKDKHENGAGMLVIGSRKAKDHIEEIEGTIELLNPLKIEDGKIQADQNETGKAQNKKSIVENHAYIVKEIMYDADRDQYVLKVKNPHSTKKDVTLISWDDLLNNFASITHFEYSPHTLKKIA